MENDFYELLQEAFSKKLVSHPLGKEEAYNQGVLACKSILHDIQKRGFRNKDAEQVVHCKDCKHLLPGYSCKMVRRGVYLEDYCSWAERRGKDGD